VRSLRQAERDMDRLKRNLAVAQEQLEAKKQLADSHALELSQMESDAGRLAPRSPELLRGRSVTELDALLHAQEDFLKRTQSQRCSDDPLHVKASLEAATLRYNDARQAIAINETLLSDLQTAITQRQAVWYDFRRSVARMSCTEFIMMLSVRGFQGSLDYRHSEKQLHIRVRPSQPEVSSVSKQQTRRQSNGKPQTSHNDEEEDPTAELCENRDVRQLSGGEKSYSTACFLFSLWHAMGSPLRCLDEFDVYMVFTILSC